MKIFNARLIGTSLYEDRHYLHFAYKSKFIKGYGCITTVSFSPVENVEINKYYDIYMTDKNGYHNLRAIYPHNERTENGEN